MMKKASSLICAGLRGRMLSAMSSRWIAQTPHFLPELMQIHHQQETAFPSLRAGQRLSYGTRVEGRLVHWIEVRRRYDGLAHSSTVPPCRRSTSEEFLSVPILSAEPADRAWPAMPMLPTSWGDVFDRLAILRLKQVFITDANRRANVKRELEVVIETIGDTSRFPLALHACLGELDAVNRALWDIEERKRECERRQCFDDEFITLARAVFQENDRRARLKKQISLLLGSALIEEKSY